MPGCRFCGFLSDPSTGTIFDSTAPCPKCGRKPAPRPTNVVPPVVRPLAGTFAAPMTVGSNIIAAAKITGIGACFIYLQKQLGNLPTNSRNSSIKQASYFIPALAVPYAVELITKEEWPILGTLFQAGVGALAIKTALQIDTSGLSKAAKARLGLKRKH